MVGKSQVKEILMGLPSKVRELVRRTTCQLMFRFGNHQTLNAKHALLIPFDNMWFRIAIVDGYTPFLLSASFLKFTGAVIDADANTLRSKRLQKYLPAGLSPSNLMLLDINELWSESARSDVQFSCSSAPTVADSTPADVSDTENGEMWRLPANPSTNHSTGVQVDR